MAVPEDFKTVTCYLPPEIAEQLESYCFKHEITRNNKQGELSPSWGTGIVEVLKLFFSSDTIPSPLPDTGLNKRMVEDMVKDSLHSILPSQLSNQLPSEEKLKELIQESVTNLLPSLLSSNVLTQDSPILKELDNRLSQLETNHNQLDREDDLNPIDKKMTEAMSDSGQPQRLSDKAVQTILKQKYNIKTTPQTVSKWRLRESQPRGRNKIIFDLFKPDGNGWIGLRQLS
ncbi:MAG: hypothetical protein QNJ42_20400 [Crocosphaera sp.]|nr:hypothetical protein [Crocosphaera sp.]